MNTAVTWQRNSGGHRSNPSRNPAIDLFNLVMDPLKFNSIGVDDLVGDNGLNTLSDFCTRIGNNPPIGQRTKKPMAVSAVKKYIEALCKELRTKFGRDPQFLNYPLFPPEDVNSLKKTFEDLHGRTLIVGAEEDALLRDYYPIPREHSPRTKLLPLHDFSNPVQQTQVRSVDLLNLCKKLLRTGQILNWLMLLATNNAIGRGGEVKFLSYGKMFWDCYSNMLFFQWFQRKELKTSPSGYVPDFAHPELCVLFAFGCYWALENGLVRSGQAMNPGTPEHRKSKFVFQNLHSVTDARVAGILTGIIRSLIHRMLQSHFTVKSLRAGAMSMLSWLPTVTYEECIAIGGWSTKASRDWYVWQYLTAIVPPALALAGYPDPRILPYAPTVEVLFTDPTPAMIFPRNRFDDFQNSLFPNSLPEFAAPQGRLRPFMFVVTAVMIKNYHHMQDTYGPDHPYVHKMRTVLVRVGLAVDLHDASNKLRHWSKKIVDDVATHNQDDDSAVLSRATVSDKLHEMSQNVSDLLRTRQQEQLNQALILSEISQLKQGQTDIKTALGDLATAVRNLTMQPAGPPPRQQTPQQPRQQTPQQQTPQPPPPPPQNVTVTPPSPPPSPPLPAQPPLQAMIRAGTAPGRGTRSSDRRIRNILSSLYEDNQCTNLRINVSLKSLANLVNTKFLGADNRETLRRWKQPLIWWTACGHNKTVPSALIIVSPAKQQPLKPTLNWMIESNGRAISLTTQGISGSQTPGGLLLLLVLGI